MSELTTEQLIKIILGILVVVVVLIGLYLFFKDRVIAFFKGLSVGNTAAVFLTLIK
jgi:hypothetical protein